MLFNHAFARSQVRLGLRTSLNLKTLLVISRR